MVFFFTTSEGYVVYMGRDKFENEDLIKYGKMHTSFIRTTCPSYIDHRIITVQTSSHI